jgi:hypothetical protein
MTNTTQPKKQEVKQPDISRAKSSTGLGNDNLKKSASTTEKKRNKGSTPTKMARAEVIRLTSK